MAVQVRSDGEGQVFGHGTLRVIDWVRSSVIFAREDFGLAPPGSAEADGQEYGVELVPSDFGVVSLLSSCA